MGLEGALVPMGTLLGGTLPEPSAKWFRYPGAISEELTKSEVSDREKRSAWEVPFALKMELQRVIMNWKIEFTNWHDTANE
jgi:hypothetical protein